MLKKYVALVLVVVLLCSLVACGGGTPKENSKAGIDSTGEKTSGDGKTTFGLEPFAQRKEIRIAYFVGSPLSLPYYIAEKEGFFEELNIDVVFENFTNGPAMMEANSDWDMAGAGLGGTLTGLVGYDVKMVGVSDYEENLALFAKPGSALAEDPENPENWKSTTWLYPMGTTAQTVLAAALAERGLSLSDINSINMDVASAVTGFKSEGDGLGVWNLMAFAAERGGYVRLTDAGQMGLAFPCANLINSKFQEDEPELAAYTYIIFHKTREWSTASDENLQKSADYYLDNNLDEGLAVDEEIAKGVVEWWLAPGFDESISIMTDTSPDDMGRYTTRELLRAESEMMEGMEFFISEGKYTEEDRIAILDNNRIDNTIAVKAKEILDGIKD